MCCCLVVFFFLSHPRIVYLINILHNHVSIFLLILFTGSKHDTWEGLRVFNRIPHNFPREVVFPRRCKRSSPYITGICLAANLANKPWSHGKQAMLHYPIQENQPESCRWDDALALISDSPPVINTNSEWVWWVKVRPGASQQLHHHLFYSQVTSECFPTSGFEPSACIYTFCLLRFSKNTDQLHTETFVPNLSDAFRLCSRASRRTRSYKGS